MARGFAEAARAVGPKLTTVELLPCLTRYVLCQTAVPFRQTFSSIWLQLPHATLAR